MKNLLIASLALCLFACSTIKHVPAPRQSLSAELAREPTTCKQLNDGDGWREVSQLFACWKQAAGINGAHVKALQGLF